MSLESNGLVLPMSGLSKCMLMFTAGALVSASAVAQVRPAPPAPRPAVPGAQTGQAATQPGAPVPGNPDYQVAPPAPVQVAPAPLPPAIWTVRDAQDLLAYIGQVGADGLNPADYDPAGLATAMRLGDPLLLSKEATDRFDRLSWDLAMGHVRKAVRVDWYVTDNDLNAAKQDALLRAALAQHRVAETLRALLPTHPQYAALRAALAAASPTDTAKIQRIRLNMDRWRWLPRDLGNKYIIVNVPGFHATLVENGVNRWKERAIAGKLSTPTPQLSATAVGVILNPWWEVPKSIQHEAAGKRGFVPVKGPDGKIQRWRQPPGPSNALGQIKFVMPNSQAIYLHDTNARSRFNSDVRALSHGCIRTMKIMDLATQLLGDDAGEWTPDKIHAALQSRKTVQANFVKPLPVYIVYFSSAALLDGTIVDYRDLYGRDGKAMVALQMKDGGASLVPKPKPPVPGQSVPGQVAAR
jgi:murein L,D-transpeptidase YcbB/YkuD